MCWNAEVSLNTFLVSIFTLAFVYYNNENTQYKLEEFKNKWLYIFFILVFSIQLFEFFIWKNLKNNYNHVFTKMIFIFTSLQPVASLMLLSNLKLRNSLILLYLVFAIPYSLFIINRNTFHSSVSKTGHLIWNNFNIIDNKSSSYILINQIRYFVFVFFLLFSFFYERKWFYLFFGFITFMLFFYKEYVSSGSTWCWVVNLISFVMLFRILFYKPFLEKGIC